MTWIHSGLAGSGSGGLAIKYADSASVDAFSRLRISSPFTLFDSKQIFNDPDITDTAEGFPLFWDNQETSGGGTGTTFNVNRASTTLTVSANTAGTRIRQTRQRFNYEPGKSQLIVLTGLSGLTSSGVVKRYGYYDGNNGVFFEDDGGTWKAVIRSFVSGAAIDTATNQSNWNIDPMDGTGPSGILLDPETVQIIFFDLEWLGVGRVRFGFFVDGMPFYCHEALHSNRLGSVYMSIPNLPIRMEISNDGTGSNDSVELICTTVISEGGQRSDAVTRWSDIGTTAAVDITAGTIGTVYPICGIKLKSNYLAAVVSLSKLSIIENSGANNPFLWKLHFNPTLTGGLTYADVSNSAVQFGVGDPAGDEITSDGTVLAGGYQSRNDATASVDVSTALRLGSLIDGTPDEIVLSATPITTNQLYFGGLQWREAW